MDKDSDNISSIEKEIGGTDAQLGFDKVDADVNVVAGGLSDSDPPRNYSVVSQNLELSHEEQFPEDPNAIPETQQFTLRAVITGSLLGGVIAASK